MAYKIQGFVDEEKVPALRRQGNEETAEIVQQLIAACDEGNTQYAFIPISDKTEKNRLVNSIRNQLKVRGYDYDRVSGTRVRRLKGGATDMIEGVYIRARKPEVESPPPVKRESQNGTTAPRKRARNKVV